MDKHHNWPECEKIIREVVNGTTLLYFDEAQAYFFENGRIINLVNIYREQLTIDKLKAIENAYSNVVRGYES